MSLKVPRDVLLNEDGTINMARWYHYWRAILSSPTQPGYDQLVRYAVKVNDQLSNFYYQYAIDLDVDGSAADLIAMGEGLRLRIDFMRRISNLNIPSEALYNFVSLPLAMRTSPPPFVLDVIVLQDAVIAASSVEVHTWGELMKAQVSEAVDDVSELGSDAMDKVSEALVNAASAASGAAKTAAVGIAVAAGVAAALYLIVTKK